MKLFILRLPISIKIHMGKQSFATRLPKIWIKTLNYIKFSVSAAVVMQLVATPVMLAAKPITHHDLTKINAALKRSPLDPRLNYLAGLGYETASVMGTDKREMAKVGYMMALKGDPSFWPAHVQLGFMAMDDRDAATAQEHFSAAAAITIALVESG